MTFKKPTRAGLDGSHFRSPARPLPSPSLPTRRSTRRTRRRRPKNAGPAVETLPCDSKVQKECSPNSGDTAWMLTSMAIVLMMTIPGLALFYGGMVRKKNVGDTVMTSFAITCLISILWLFFTYSLAFREGGEIFGFDMGWFIGGLDRAGLQGILSDIANNKGNPNSLAPTIPRVRLLDVPADLRDHHGGPDRRLVRGAHEVLGHAVVHRPVGGLRLLADRPLGVGPGWHVQQLQPAQLHQRAGFRRRHRGACQFGHRRPDVLR